MLDFEVKYNECDLEYIEELRKYFTDHYKDIMLFFNLNKLSKKLIINIFDDVDKYKKYRNNINDTSVGNMDFDDTYYYLNILSYKEITKRKTHENATKEYMYKTIIHEFVHICHEESGYYKDSYIWIKEGLAIVLSNQYGEISYKIDNCTLDDLINNKRVWYINYYSLVDYILKKYGVNYLTQIVFDKEFALNQVHIIYNEVLELNKKH